MIIAESDKLYHNGTLFIEPIASIVRKNGAIEKFFRKHVQSEFFGHHFQDDDSVRIVKNGMLTRRSQVQLMERSDELVEGLSASSDPPWVPVR